MGAADAHRGAGVILAGKRLLITGVITKDSIAFHAATRAQEEGAEVLLTSFGRVRRLTERAAQRLPQPVDVLELDVNNAEDLEALGAELRTRWGTVDGVLHAIAFAPEDALGGRFMTAPLESASQGLWGGLRAQLALRQMFVYLDGRILNKPEVIIPQVNAKIDHSTGELTDPARFSRLMADRLTQTV